MKYAAIILALGALAGCMNTAQGVDPLEPRVTDFNGHMVRISYHPYAVGNAPESPIVKKANQVCSGVGKVASYGSFVRVNPYEGIHTYVCVK